MHHVILCLGSNVKPRREHIARALWGLDDIIAIEAASAYAESDDITGRGKPYVNRVIKCRTSLSLEQLRQRLSDAESDGGRTPERTAAGIVDIDIDLVVWDTQTISPTDFNRPYFQHLYQSL